MKRVHLCAALMVMTMLSGIMPAQATANRENTSPAVRAERGPLYQLKFVVKEVEGGKVINSREYYSSLAIGSPGKIRTGSKVPVATGYTSSADPNQRQTQYTYIDVGINIDFRDAQIENNQLLMTIKAEISSVDAAGIDAGHQPVIRQMQWESPVSVALEKPTTIFSSDDVFSKRTTQVEVTAKLMR